MIYKLISECRICSNTKLVPILDLGMQALTGFFPNLVDQVEEGPLQLVKCDVSEGSDSCGLLQLKHNYQMEKLYGDHYGYRSGLNPSMVEHLCGIVVQIEEFINLNSGDLVIDIASNDGTLLSAYKNRELLLVGIDPTAEKFKSFYPNDVRRITDFFSSEIVNQNFGKKKARVITSISMFYDLYSPLETMREIESILADDGIWVVEQSYMPTMLSNISYDTICHEHLEYYALKQFKWMADRSGLKIIDIQFNSINGASFSITLAKKESQYCEATQKITNVLEKEIQSGLDEYQIYRNFANEVETHRKLLVTTLQQIVMSGSLILGYGASTKGNVILQYCGIDKKLLPFISEVNPDKFHKYTPGSNIPIISEIDAVKLKPDYYLVLPWHFRESILKKEKIYLEQGGKMIFPLPKINVV
jgi:NDP-4-keto-2,6-dideoxyhexose 3-C-methyltransferase